MVSKYPNAIDGYSEIRVVRDGIEEVVARDHNDNRSAVVAMEQTLGIRPAGAYGTVVARLNQADDDFATHISGTGHRHTTNHIDYPGSGSHTFADGYALIPARLGDTLDELVSLIGTTSPAGATGGDKVGISPFWTPTPKYQFASDSVRGQQVEAGNYLDENATLLERALDAFVVDGMEVVDPYATGATARIAAGHIVSDGRLLRYDGGDLAVPASGTFYVFARISAGTVSVGIEDGTLPSLDPENPIVLLKKIVRSGGAWNSSLSTDIRRYGMLVNNKNFFSVGNTPSGGRDGYGCDFTSLKGAVDYVRALSAAGRMIAPLRVTLVDDIEISNDAALEIVLDVHGMEIDGCGNHITVTTSSPSIFLFRVEADHIRIHDVEAVSNCATSVLSFAGLGSLSSVDNTHVVNCHLETVPGKQPFDRFLRFGEITGVLQVTGATISDNVVEVQNGGIVYETAGTGADILQESKITGNSVIQAPLTTSLFYGIQAGSRCVVSGNLVYGGFTAGIALHVPVDTVVTDNIVLGTDGSTTYMTTGIAVYTGSSGTGNEYGALISGNIIKGIVNGGFGIDNKAGARSALQSVIANNIIDNSNITTWPMGAYGIRVNRYEVPVVGNKINWMGYPIDRAGFVVGNDIYGHGVGAGDGILCVPAAVSATVCNNRLYNLNCSGSAINVNQSDHAVVANNLVRNCVGTGYLSAGINMGRGTEAVIADNVVSHSTIATATIGVSDIGDDSVVCGNVIINQEYGGLWASAAGVKRTSFVDNKVYNCGTAGVELTDGTDCIVAGNMLIVDDPTLSPWSGISGFADNCLVASNIVKGYGSGGYYGISGDFGAFRSAMIANNMVIGLHANTQGAISMQGGWRDVAVVNNIVVDTNGVGIHMASSARSIVSGNLLLGTVSGARSGIYKVGEYSAVVGNAILRYGNFGGSNAGISLLDAYSSAVVGNTIAADSALTYGILLDGTGIDNLIASNVLNGLVWTGIELGTLHLSARNIVSSNIIVGTSSGNDSPGISNLCSQSVAIGNDISYANGDAIRVVPGWAALLSTWTGSAVVGNMVNDPDAYGIHVDAVGGLVRLDGYSDLNGCLVSGNHVASTTAHHGGIYLNDTWRATVSGNFVKNFNVGIWLLGVSQGCVDNLVCGNNVQQDPVQAIGSTGIWVDAGCTSNHVVGNFVFGPVVGIQLDANLCSICSNHVVWARGGGIDAAGTIDVAITGNYVGPGYPLSIFVDGINVFGCRKTLVSGNLAFGYLLGMSFRVDDLQPGDGLVMSGNLARDGFAAPYKGDGVGGTWSTGKVTDVDCRYITP